MILNKKGVKYLNRLAALSNSKVARCEYILSFPDPQWRKNIGVRPVKDNCPSLNLADGSSADGLSVVVGTEKKTESVSGCIWMGR